MNIVKSFKDAFERAKAKKWNRMYVLIDMHGTIFKPSYLNEEKFEYYDYAIAAIRLMNEYSYEHPKMEIKTILWTSTTQEATEEYVKRMNTDGIKFDYINKNPEVKRQKTDPESTSFKEKFYFNVGIDDKFGFNPEKDWKKIYDYLMTL